MVLALAGYSKGTLRSRQRAGRMPLPIDRGKHGGIYDRDAVLKALGITKEVDQPVHDPWDFTPGALREHLASRKRKKTA
ncbi:MAG: hypothetical protein K2X07_09700 [Caulobacteraceae bacterium]|nr:hypothetical protein [Caulobacteraceae bacterium]